MLSTKKDETWKAVVGFEERYEVSDLGRVRSKDMIAPAKAGSLATRKGRVLAPSFCSFGYAKVTLACGDKRYQENIHVLVLLAFVGPRPGPYPLIHARHLNGKRTDNRAGNLTWGTALENNLDKRSHGTMLRGSQVNTAKLTESEVSKIIRSKQPNQELASRYKVSDRQIWAIKTGKAWAHMQRGEK